MDQVYEVWIEIQANKKLISDSEKFREAMEKCKKAGMTGIILSVKDTSGFVLYKSSLADHYSEFDGEFAADIDYAAECFKIIRELGMKCYAAFDVFAEGNKKNRHPLMKGFREGWQCEVYGLDEGGNAVIQKSTEEKALKTVGSIDDFGEIFVNPGNKEVCSYELSLLKEFAENYKPDAYRIARNNAAKTVFRTVICFFILSSSTFQILFALIVPHLPFSSPFILTNVCVKFYANFYLFVLNYTQR